MLPTDQSGAAETARLSRRRVLKHTAIAAGGALGLSYVKPTMVNLRLPTAFATSSGAPPRVVVVPDGSPTDTGGPAPIHATLTAGCGSIKQVRFRPSSNAVNSATALIDISGGPTGQKGTFTYTPPPGTRRLTVTVRRTQPGPVTIPVTVIDECGEWPSFVGAGSAVR
ncbi:MAG: twin-arginine translocation signal domain-containing protein [Chloroflexota bacterium]